MILNRDSTINSSSLRIHLRLEITHAGGARGPTRVEISYTYGQKSIVEIRNQVAVRAPLFCSRSLYKANPAVARPHSLRPPACHTAKRYSAARSSVRTHAQGFCTKLTPSPCWLTCLRWKYGYEIGGNKRLVEIPLGLLPPSRPTTTWTSRD